MPPLPPLVLGGAVMVVLAYRGGAEALFLGLVLTVLACLAWRLADPAEGFLRDVAALDVHRRLRAVPGRLRALLAVPDDGPRRVTAFIAVVVCSDIGGYVAGVLFGKHPMAPTVSPKKSWEGFAGSAARLRRSRARSSSCTLFDASPGARASPTASPSSVTATVGDLGESMIKRDIGIKDMGTLLPGHGGLMDRLDSLLPTAPVAWLLLAAFVPYP